VAWVARGERNADGLPVVLKLDGPELESAEEGDALAFWDGQGAVRLLAQDRARRALLLERCDPGVQLWALWDEATSVVAEVFRALWRPAAGGGGGPLLLLADDAARWAVELPVRWEALGRPVPRALIDEAVALCSELTS
jgi:streptomycin 6-kinase